MTGQAINWETVIKHVEEYTEPVDGMGRPVVIDLDNNDVEGIETALIDVQREIHRRGFLTEDHKYTISPKTKHEIRETFDKVQHNVPQTFKTINGLPIVEESALPDGYVFLFNPEFVLMSGRIVNPQGVGLVKNITGADQTLPETYD